MRLSGFAAIEYAEKAGLTLNKAANHTDPERHGLTVAAAVAIASEDPGLIWLDVPDSEDYFDAGMEPGR
jgi:hypothetical protein